MQSSFLLGRLPEFQNNAVLIQKQQTVFDIINEVLTAHEIFAADYNNIASDFYTGNTETTCKKLFDFCKANVRYKIEGEGRQTTKSPAAILTIAEGDCKHYAGFIGGVLDAINRIYSAKINWSYRFASYNYFDKTPAHVFIIVQDGKKELWIDPVLKFFNQRVEPSYFIDKKIKANTMALVRISGLIEDINANSTAANELLDTTPYADNPAYYMAIQTLLKYSIMDINANVNPTKLASYQTQLPAATFQEVTNAYYKVTTEGGGVMNGLFDDIWRSIKVVTMAAPRGAYLGLVAINAFGYATKLKAAIYKPDGTYTSFKPKLKDIWENKFGGQWTILQNTINQGATHRAILGAEPITLAMWTATATAIIAAITPLLKAFLTTGAQSGEIPNINYNIDPVTGQPYAQPTGSTSFTDFIRENPAIIIGGAAVAIYLYQKNKRA